MSVGPRKPSAKVRPGDKRSARERAIAMCEHVSRGTSLRRAGEIEGMGDPVFLRLVKKDDELRIMYEAAREGCVEANCSELSEEATEVMKYAKAKGKAATAYVSAFVAKANIAKWKAERLLPKVYGNRIDINHSGAIDLAGRLSKARERTKES